MSNRSVLLPAYSVMEKHKRVTVNVIQRNMNTDLRCFECKEMHFCNGVWTTPVHKVIAKSARSSLKQPPQITASIPRQEVLLKSQCTHLQLFCLTDFLQHQHCAGAIMVSFHIGEQRYGFAVSVTFKVGSKCKTVALLFGVFRWL